MIENEVPFVIFSDLHGRIKLLETVSNQYDGIQLISLGDVVDSPDYGDTKETIDLLLELGTICISGNHDWAQGAVMYSEDEISRADWAKDWSGIESGTIASYGVKKPSINEKNSYDYVNAALELKEAVERAGHEKYFKELKPYYETNDSILIHGGLINIDKKWYGERGVRQHLDQIAGSTNLDEIQWDTKPEVIFDKYHWRALSRTIPEFIGKTLITGHDHSEEAETTRVTDNGRRVRLAGYLSEEMPLYVYESWTGKVVPLYPKIKNFIS